MSRRAISFANRFPAAANYAPTASLTTPTFDGSGETTEPTWIAKPSWVTVTCTDILAHNPLPGGDVDYENPSILVSNDQGDTWTTPPGLTNPIAAKPTAIGLPGNNADCHLIADPNTNWLIMCWYVSGDPNVVGGANQNGIWYSTCTDPALVTWSARAPLFNLNGVGAPEIESTEIEPKIVWDATRGKFLFYTLKDNAASGGAHQIKVRVGGTNPLTGYGSAQNCVISLPGSSRSAVAPFTEYPWHMDIIQEASGRFIMVFCDTHYAAGPALARQAWIASSSDGIHWQCAPRPFMRANDWAPFGLYRPSILPARTGAGYDVITSRHQNPTARLGIARNIPKTEIP